LAQVNGSNVPLISASKFRTQRRHDARVREVEALVDKSMQKYVDRISTLEASVASLENLQQECSDRHFSGLEEELDSHAKDIDELLEELSNVRRKTEDELSGFRAQFDGLPKLMTTALETFGMLRAVDLEHLFSRLSEVERLVQGPPVTSKVTFTDASEFHGTRKDVLPQKQPRLDLASSLVAGSSVRSPSFGAGCQVELTGLKSEYLNGCVGTIIAHENTECRFAVRLQEHGTKLIHRANLSLLNPARIDDGGCQGNG